MTINKFQGKTQEEAIEKAKLEFGEDAVIMNVREVKPKGLFSVFKSSTYEVTAAMKETENYAAVARSTRQNTALHDTINLAADEKIDFTDIGSEAYAQPARRLPPVKRTAPAAEPREMTEEMEKEIIRQPVKKETKRFEERLDDLSDRLEESLADGGKEERVKAPSFEELNFVRILYSTLIKNEVNEKYINQVLEEVEKFIRPGNNVDIILSNVYQKLILQFGQPRTIELGTKKPKVVFFVGPTGVGKTTTIAKIASKYKVEYNKKIAFITSDTYRIAASEQLQVYANILEAPMAIVYSAEELNEKLEEFTEEDLVFVDTAGFSHKNREQRNDVKKLVMGLDERFSKEVYLVLSATTKYRDLLDIVDVYREITDYKLIFTKLDETTTYGNILNIKLYSGADLSYVTTGQNVPDDIEVFDTQKIVKQLLGGNT